VTLASVNTVVLLAFDGCHTAAIASLTDLLRIANMYAARNETGPLFHWRTVSPDGRSVQAMGGLGLSVDGDLQDVSEPTVIFIPGIWYKDDGELAQRVDRLWLACRRWFESAYAQGASLAASCSGTFLLARTGLLDRRKATTSWWLEQTFRATFPRVRLHADELVTQDHRLWCGGAYTAYLNLGLRLVEELASPAVARACARIMLIDANRAVQTPYAILQTHVGHSDDLVWRAQTWMQARLMERFRIQAVADALQVTERTLIRHFKRTLGETPGRYLQSLRVEAARWLLETTQLNLEQIIERVGYADISSFRRLFERETRLSPREYRQRFSLSAKSSGVRPPGHRGARGPQRRSA
jgi:transcriptional regulator GlxA family with amidase domain